MFDSSQINRFVKCKRQIWKMMTKKMSLLLTGMLLCLAPDMQQNRQSKQQRIGEDKT